MTTVTSMPSYDEVNLIKADTVSEGHVLAGGLLDRWEVTWIEHSGLSGRARTNLKIGAMSPDKNSTKTVTLLLPRTAEVPVYSERTAKQKGVFTQLAEARAAKLDAVKAEALELRAKAPEDNYAILSLIVELAEAAK